MKSKLYSHHARSIGIVPINTMFAATLVLLLADAGAAYSQSQKETEPMKLADLYPVLAPDAAVDYPVQLSEEQWRERLTDFQYHVLREKGTEPAGTGIYDSHYEEGTYHSAATGQPLFASDTKFKSGTGWPSFFQAVSPDAVVLKWDYSYGMRRIEVLDSSSGSHLGHVFEDGPAPTGLRFCINSASLIFVPEGEEPPALVKEFLAEYGA